MALTNAELHALAERIADNLIGWEYDAKESLDADGELSYMAFIRAQGSEARIRLQVTHGAGKLYRLKVSAHVPYYVGGSKVRFELYSYEPTSRTFAWDREPARIAAEVSRDVLGCARKIAELYREACDKREAREVCHEIAMTSLAVTVGDRFYSSRPDDLRASFELAAGTCHVDGKVDSGTISLALSDVLPGQVARILALLRESP